MESTSSPALMTGMYSKQQRMKALTFLTPALPELAPVALLSLSQVLLISLIKAS